MTRATHIKSERTGFWKRLGGTIKAMETTEAEHQWDAIRILRAENDALKARLRKIEADGVSDPEWNAITAEQADVFLRS